MDRISSSRAGGGPARPITSRPLTSAARPMTSTGLMAPRTSRGRSAMKRQVQDKSYFMGLLRSKMNELNIEITRLSQECETMAKEESRTGVYKKKAEALAREIAEQTKELAVYNEFNGRLQVGEDENEIKEDVDGLKNENELLSTKLESNYEKKKQTEVTIREYERETEKIEKNLNNIRRQFTAEQREKYDALEKVNQQLNFECEQLEQHIVTWRDKKSHVELNSDSDSLIRREILQAVGKLRDLEKQRDDMLSESNNSGDERGRLLAQVKRDNKEIASVEARLNEINDKTQEIKSELEAYEDVGATDKFKELKKKEETIESFLSDFETSKNSEIRKMEMIGAEINELTGRLSRCLAHIESLKGSASDQGIKDKEKDSGKSSLELMQDEKRKLELDLNKIEQLEEKISTELDSLRNKINNYQVDIKTYSDIPKLKAQIEEKIESLVSEKSQIKEMSEESVKSNEQLKSELNSLKSSVEKNEINKKIKALEGKLSDILANNESLKSTINGGMNTNLKAQVMEEVKKYNQRLLGY